MWIHRNILAPSHSQKILDFFLFFKQYFLITPLFQQNFLFFEATIQCPFEGFSCGMGVQLVSGAGCAGEEQRGGSTERGTVLS